MPLKTRKPPKKPGPREYLVLSAVDNEVCIHESVELLDGKPSRLFSEQAAKQVVARLLTEDGSYREPVVIHIPGCTQITRTIKPKVIIEF